MSRISMERRAIPLERPGLVLGSQTTSGRRMQPWHQRRRVNPLGPQRTWDPERPWRSQSVPSELPSGSEVSRCGGRTTGFSGGAPAPSASVVYLIFPTTAFISTLRNRSASSSRRRHFLSGRRGGGWRRNRDRERWPANWMLFQRELWHRSRDPEFRQH